MNRDERIRNQLGTVMSAAVRLGMTTGSMPREAIAAEVRDLVELAITVTQPVLGELSAEGEKCLAWQKTEGRRQAEFWRNVDASVPDDLLAGHAPSVQDVVGMTEVQKFIDGLKAQGIREVQPEPVPSNTMPRAASCMAFADADDMHDHSCSKETGHAYGPSGSDHLCEQCGQLFTSPTDEDPSSDVEIEL